MLNKSQIVGICACFCVILSCFLPWVHYTSIHETFTGFHVRKFDTGNYYGKAGIPIAFFSVFILILILVPKIWAKRVNLLLSALLFAYAIRTYIIFTSALFENEVEKKVGIYLMIFFSAAVLVSAVFPDIRQRKNKN